MSKELIVRPRRLRQSETWRSLVRETTLDVSDLIYPLFIVEDPAAAGPIASMPGIHRYHLEQLPAVMREIASLGVQAVLLFGIPIEKDELASGAYSPEGIVQRAIAAIKEGTPHVLVMTDVCLCEYTSHGHCGTISGHEVLNDPTLDLLARTALSHAQAGADLIAPSDMMDGRVGAIREALDLNGYSHVPIMSYAAKYASAFYGPFRDAAGSTPQFGDRRSYQMDPANRREALKEVALDVSEGADIIMVKPAVPYQDIIWQVKQSTQLPVAAYHVSGEYAMLKAAAERGWLDEQRAVMETMIGLKRSGADLIITYYALAIARWLSVSN